VDLDKAVEEQLEKHKDVVASIETTEKATQATTSTVSVESKEKSTDKSEVSTAEAKSDKTKTDKEKNETKSEKDKNEKNKSETKTDKTKEKNETKTERETVEKETEATSASDNKKDDVISDTAVETKGNTSSSNTGSTASSSKTNTGSTSSSSTGTSSTKTGWVYKGGVWASDSCGTCSLAMVLSTLSGVTVSPPEVALAANALIGEKAWYKTILLSQSQAKLAELAGFTVKTENYNTATKAAMDDCLDNNGMALFVTDKSTWASLGGRHYIAVRNRVGDKYYTADSGKNPTGGYTYEQLSSGYNQQMIVYIYPKGYGKTDK
jgi:hypothetical protein